jgi:alanine racemase
LIDVTNVHDVQLNDQVTLLGGNKATSDVSISAEDLARIVGTLSYEVTCGVGQRVPRVYV